MDKLNNNKLLRGNLLLILENANRVSYNLRVVSWFASSQFIKFPTPLTANFLLAFLDIAFAVNGMGNLLLTCQLTNYRKLYWGHWIKVTSFEYITETDNTALYTIKKLITNMQNRHVHHLIGTKLSCAPQKCTFQRTASLCTMVHNARWWCPTQVDGAQRVPVLTR